MISSQKIHDLYGLKHHIVDMRGGVTDAGRTNKQTLKIELLSQWKLEAEFRNKSQTFCLWFLIKPIASLSREVKKVSPQVEFVCSRGRPDDPKDILLYIHDHCSSVMVMLIPRDGLEADPVSKVGRTGGSTCFAAAPECPQFSPLCFIRPFSLLQCSQFDLHSVLFYQGTVFLLFIAMECLLRMLTNPF